MKLTMNLGARSYDIILKRGCLSNLYQFTDLTHRKVFILTDSGVPNSTHRPCWPSARREPFTPCPRAKAASASRPTPPCCRLCWRPG